MVILNPSFTNGMAGQIAVDLEAIPIGGDFQSPIDNQGYPDIVVPYIFLMITYMHFTYMYIYMLDINILFRKT